MTVSLSTRSLLCFILHDTPATLKTIDEMCERLYVDTLMDVAYLVIARDDMKPLLHEVASSSWVLPPGETLIQEVSLVRYINKVTGRLMDVFVSDQFKEDTILFGSYETQSQPTPFELTAFRNNTYHFDARKDTQS